MVYPLIDKSYSLNQLFLLPQNIKRIILVFVDSTLLAAAVLGAMVLQYGSLEPMQDQLFNLLILAPLVSVPMFFAVGLYKTVIRFFSDKALLMLVKGISLAVAMIAVLSLIYEPLLLSWTLLGIYWVLALLLIGGSRVMVKALYHNYRVSHSTERIVIYGAGQAGVQLVQALQAGKEFSPVAFVDNKIDLVGRVIQGVPVYMVADLEKITKEKKVNQIFLALPSSSRTQRREIIEELESYPVQVKTIPSLIELAMGCAQISDIQNIDIVDLLGRDPVAPNEELLSCCIKDKVVMITGAGGSIGAELSRQAYYLLPKKIIMFDVSEAALYQVERLLTQQSTDVSVEIISVIGTVTNREHLKEVIASFGVETIYHAAAYKHVPMVELNPIEGVKNNLFGTLAAAEAARELGVETFVLISTDKAVRPTNVMGASKRMAELVLQALANEPGRTRFCMVRFGNVLGSSGSVKPLFQQQIENNGPVTVTHPEITRYFMTVTEAAQLVLQASAMGLGGDVFVLDMGKPVKIADLARRMIHLCGLRVKTAEYHDGDIEIVYTGLRPGEKLYEELLIGDNVSATKHPLILRAHEILLPWSDLKGILHELEGAMRCFDSMAVRQILENAIVGYYPQCKIVDPIWLSKGAVRVNKLMPMTGELAQQTA